MVHSVDPFSDLGIAALRIPEYSGPAAFDVWTLLRSFTRPGDRPRALATTASQRECRCRLHRFVMPVTAIQLLLLAILIFSSVQQRVVQMERLA